jgi:hypothetical protein
MAMIHAKDHKHGGPWFPPRRSWLRSQKSDFGLLEPKSGLSDILAGRQPNTPRVMVFHVVL